ncbi:galactose-specific lectin nattectin-like isoform X3 [Sparus aurata]|uniref:galactose-specific lectin nattectin-like isoform X3 n=1 Tax=Sparus aurata TaxID=8175 RepID=UPI0011C1A4E4|nr:galactose-specific lectin nattectin-like isoform X3 [Sparus aurata]
MASALPLIVLLCLVVGQLDVSAAADCPSGWSLFGSRCFIVQTNELTMADAERNCISIGGNLASIHNINDHNWISGMVKKALGSDKWAWIGLSDAIQEGKWLWTDGSRFVFSRWGSGEPSNKGDKEHCTHINYIGEYWNDYLCDAKLPSVCVGGR